MTTGDFGLADLAFSLPSRGEATGLSSRGPPEGADGFDHFDSDQRTSFYIRLPVSLETTTSPRPVLEVSGRARRGREGVRCAAGPAAT